MASWLKEIVKSAVNSIGYDITRLETKDYLFAKMLKNRRIDTILDVGANVGQYAEMVFRSGFEGNIISFEPQKAPFGELAKKLHKRWKAYNFALGNSNKEVIMNISASDDCSSIPRNNSKLTSVLPSAQYVGKQSISMRRLDDCYNEISPGKRIFLKLDVQGYERECLKGAMNSLKNGIVGVQLELHPVPLYENEPSMEEQISYMKGVGYELYSLHPQYISKEGKAMNYDGVFFKD
jgi:FkbM family methyltransferase